MALMQLPPSQGLDCHGRIRHSLAKSFVSVAEACPNRSRGIKSATTNVGKLRAYLSIVPFFLAAAGIILCPFRKFPRGEATFGSLLPMAARSTDLWHGVAEDPLVPSPVFVGCGIYDGSGLRLRV